jgi:hypothetical protein
MEPKPQGRRVTAVVVSYYPDLGFGFLIANGTRVGFKKAALQGFAADPRPGDHVDADVGDDGVALSVAPLPGGAPRAM